MTNKLIPFDLECARKGDIFVSRDGYEAKLIFENDSAGLESNYKLWFAIKNTDGGWVYAATSINGCYHKESDSVYDIFMKPKTKKVYIWIERHIATGCKFHKASNAAPEENKDLLERTYMNGKVYEIEIEVDE